MRILRKILTFVDIISMWPLYAASLLVPRDKHLWTFIGWHRSPDGEIFADNTKHFFLHVSENEERIRAVWLAKSKNFAQLLRSKGYESYYERSLRGIWCALRSGITVLDAYMQRENFKWSGRTKILQLLHGKGMKAGGYAKPQLRKQDYICAPSKYVASLLPPQFTAGSATAVTGYSRDDVFFRPLHNADIGIDKTAAKVLAELIGSDGKRILYAPTFRRGEKTFDIERRIPLGVLSHWARKHNIHFFMSLHPKYREQMREHDHPHIYFIEDSDITPLLPDFDLLITDYSSIFTDFLLLDRPIVFYPYDIETYGKEEGIIQHYDDITPGPKAYSFIELLEMTDRVLSDDRYADKRRHIRDMYHAYADGKSSERIVTFVREKEGISSELTQ